MYEQITFYCYSPLDLDLFIYKYDPNKQQTEIIRTHIYENSSNGKNIFKRRIVSMFNAKKRRTGKII